MRLFFTLLFCALATSKASAGDEYIDKIFIDCGESMPYGQGARFILDYVDWPETMVGMSARYATFSKGVEIGQGCIISEMATENGTLIFKNPELHCQATIKPQTLDEPSKYEVQFNDKHLKNCTLHVPFDEVSAQIKELDPQIFAGHGLNLVPVREF